MNEITINSKILTEVIDGKSITVDLGKIMQKGVAYFNATEFAKPYKKQASDFMRLSRTKELIRILDDDVNTRNGKSPFGSKPKKIKIVEVRKGGNDKHNQGTWLHQDLALEFARWLSPRFGLELDRYIKHLFQESTRVREERLISKYAFKESSREVARQGGEYKEEGNLICQAMFGMTAESYKKKFNVKSVWDNQPADILEKRIKLIEMNTVLMKGGMSRSERLRYLIQI